MKYQIHRLIPFFLLAFCILPHTALSATAKALALSADAGKEYVDRMVFFGESTTAHLARKGGILDGCGNRVLRDESGTRMLSRRTLTSPVLLRDDTGTTRTVAFVDAIAVLKPRMLVLSFGLNGLDGFVREPSRFTESYRALIDGVLAVSPDTRILLQSVYPVACAIGSCGDVDAQNAAIRRLNEQIEALAEQWEATRYVDTASVLTGGDGRLLSQYDSGDGIHLTNDAYRQILSYLRTHAWI